MIFRKSKKITEKSKVNIYGTGRHHHHCQWEIQKMSEKSKKNHPEIFMRQVVDVYLLTNTNTKSPWDRWTASSLFSSWFLSSSSSSLWPDPTNGDDDGTGRHHHHHHNRRPHPQNAHSHDSDDHCNNGQIQPTGNAPASETKVGRKPEDVNGNSGLSSSW